MRSVSARSNSWYELNLGRSRQDLDGSDGFLVIFEMNEGRVQLHPASQKFGFILQFLD